MSKPLTLSYTQINTWKRCRQKWFYRYGLGLEPKKKVMRIELGNYGHALLEAYYKGEDLQQASEKYWAEQTDKMFKEEMLDFEQVRSDAEKLVERYINNYQEDNWNIHAIEEFSKVNIPTLRGYPSRTNFLCKLDLVVEEDTGQIWLVDHKLTSRDIEKYEDALVLDEQANYYLWGLCQLLGGQVAGIIFNLIRTKLPTVPQVLKRGGLSVAKSIDTDVQTYLQAIKDNGYNPKDYVDILNHIKETAKPFFKRHRIVRSWQEIQEIGGELYLVANDIRNGKIFTNATSDCSWDCPFHELCIMEKKRADTKFYIKANFNQRGDKVAVKN